MLRLPGAPVAEVPPPAVPAALPARPGRAGDQAGDRRGRLQHLLGHARDLPVHARDAGCAAPTSPACRPTRRASRAWSWISSWWAKASRSRASASPTCTLSDHRPLVCDFTSTLQPRSTPGDRRMTHRLPTHWTLEPMPTASPGSRCDKPGRQRQHAVARGADGTRRHARRGSSATRRAAWCSSPAKSGLHRRRRHQRIHPAAHRPTEACELVRAAQRLLRAHRSAALPDRRGAARLRAGRRPGTGAGLPLSRRRRRRQADAGPARGAAGHPSGFRRHGAQPCGCSACARPWT